MTTATAGTDDTFPKLSGAQRTSAPGANGVPAQGSRDLAVLDTGPRCTRSCAPIAVGLAALGLKRGDKIAIVGYNRPHLYWAMAAAQWLGAVPIPVYADCVADEMAYVLAHAEVTHAVVQDQEQVDKLLSVAEQRAARSSTSSTTRSAACAITTTPPARH